MKSGKLMCFIVIALFAALAVPLRIAAQDNHRNDYRHHHYKLIDMGTFGGPNSSINWPIKGGSLNRRGVTVGWSATPASTTPTSNPLICGGLDGEVPFITHAFQWQKAIPAPLLTFEGLSNQGDCTVFPVLWENGTTSVRLASAYCSEPTWITASQRPHELTSLVVLRISNY